MPLFQFDINAAPPTVMHIDLNSCFATIEQQAYVHFRGRPLVVAAYPTPTGCVVSPSIEAKRLGIKVGMSVREARCLCRSVIVRTPDPPKIRDVHTKFKRIFKTYSPDVVPKSIDEVVVDFSEVTQWHPNLVSVAKEIKARVRDEVGEWIRCSIGIAPNRFLAKVAAGLQKPDGLIVINHANLLSVYSTLSLIDLPGINTRFEARLNAQGIFSPLQFLQASEEVLHKRVFQSINGYYWYMRLRGWEVDKVEWDRRTYGQSYALRKPTADDDELSRLLMKLCEKMGRRIRRAQCRARGIHIGALLNDGRYWHRGTLRLRPMYATIEFYRSALNVLHERPPRQQVINLSVQGYALEPRDSGQLELFAASEDRRVRVSDALDRINDRYGEYVVTAASMLDMREVILDRISFGNVKELEDLYAL